MFTGVEPAPQIWQFPVSLTFRAILNIKPHIIIIIIIIIIIASKSLHNPTKV